MLEKEINDIIKKYGLNKIFEEKQDYIEIIDLEENVITSIVQKNIESKNKEIVIYPLGKMGREIIKNLKKRNVNVSFAIDNYSSNSEFMSIPVISMEEYIRRQSDELIILCSLNINGQLKEEMLANGFDGEIIDLLEVIKEKYWNYQNCLFEKYLETPEELFDYVYINKLELQIRKEIDYRKKKTLIREIIYGLFLIRDFYTANLYIELYKKIVGSYENYEGVYRHVIDTLNKAVKKLDVSNVLVLHIIDSLQDNLVEDMPFLKAVSQTGIRLSGLYSSYPYTHYAINTMFTGKDSFEIDHNERISYEDSELLKYIKNNGITVSLLTGSNHLKEEFDEIDNAKSPKKLYKNISSILFSGLCEIEKKSNNHIVILHSHWEVHNDFYSIGLDYGLQSAGKLNTTKKIKKQFVDAVKYVDHQLRWYYSFYNYKNIKNVFLGDHGISVESTYNYFHGIKKDYPRCSIENCTPAFIIANSRKKQHIKGLISSEKESDIILDILKDTIDNFSKYNEAYVILKQVPGYSEFILNNFVPKGMYSHYMGAIGMITEDGFVYIQYVSGKEDFFCPSLYRYKNLINSSKYMDIINDCRKKLKNVEFDYSIFKLEKYNVHLEFLKLYNKDVYNTIKSKM